ncbi:MAG: TA system VapC family ribonuclease toxin [Vicinamibacteria bacterium]
MIALLDVNVLVALLVPTHEHHAAARRWVTTTGAADGWATCPLTELGVIRVCAQLSAGARPPRLTANVLLQLRVSSPGYCFWPDAMSPATMAEVRQADTARQVTDRYLLGLTRRYGGVLLTCDRALALAGGPDAVDLLESQ